MERYAVFGNPVAHSLSPKIHQLFAHQTQQKILYEAIKVELGNLKDTLNHFFSHHGLGANITLPFKEEAFQLVHHHTPRAQAAKAVNTLLLEKEGTLLGDNTDGVGLIRDLCQYYGHTLQNKRVLLLGAGGAIRGILGAVLACQPSLVFIANRTVSKARIIAQAFETQGVIMSGGFEDVAALSFDIIINGTSASLADTVIAMPSHVYKQKPVCYDLMYGEKAAHFLNYSLCQGASYAYSGLGMLIEQAAESFFLWRGVRPDTQRVRAHFKSLTF